VDQIACVMDTNYTVYFLIPICHFNAVFVRSLLHTTLCCFIVVNLLTLTPYQGTDLGYSFIANFRHLLIHDSLIFARFSAMGMGVSSYVGQLIGEYRYIFTVQYLHECIL